MHKFDLAKTNANPRSARRYLITDKIMTRFIFILILFPFFSFTQNKSSSNNIPKIKIRKNSNLTIETNSSDVFYIGTTNIIVLKGQDRLSYSLTIENGTITPDYDHTNDSIVAYYIKVNNSGQTYITFDNGQVIFKQKYRNKLIPDPKICLSTKFGRYFKQEISDTVFQTASFVSAVLNGFDYNLTTQFVSCKIKKITSDNQLFNFTQQGNNISTITKDAKSGDIYIFYDILVDMCEPKERRQINGLTFLIK
jgi:hypothetical protein